jgi:PAS domain S-box-containing protein
MEPARSESGGAFASVDWRVAATALFVFTGCFLGSMAGALLRLPGLSSAAVFPPYAILTAVLIFSSPRTWWIYLLASLAGHLAGTLSHLPTGWILLSQLANSTKALIAALAIRQFNHGARLDSLRRMLVFFAFVVVIAPAAAGLIPAAAGANSHSGNAFWLTWRAWFLSNALTAVALLPVLLIGITDGRKWLRTGSIARWLEAILIVISLLAVSLFALVLREESVTTLPPKLYCLLPVLLWAAVRFGTGGAGMAVLSIAAMAISGAMRGRGPFAATTEDLLSLQLFVIILSMPVLFLAALMEERNDVAEKLREREERIDLAAETANFALWTIDFERGESWMSEKGRELFGFTPDEPPLREGFLERVHPEDREAVANAMDRARAASEAFEIEFRLLRPDGENRWLNARGRYSRNARGEVGELIGAGIDVTDRRQAEDAARNLAHLSRVSSLGVLSGSLAHELNQPLGIILSNAQAAEFLLETEHPDLDQLRAMIADIVSEDRRAGDVIKRLRALLRRGETAAQPLDVNESVREMMRLTQSDFIARSVTAELQFGSGLPRVLADHVQLQQVLLNLAINACEAMAANEARERIVLVETSAADGGVRIAVRDRGHGLPDDTEKLFEAFHTTKEHGLGMGLAICRALVTAHAGRLWAEPNPGGGATFFVTFPAVSEPA